MEEINNLDQELIYQIEFRSDEVIKNQKKSKNIIKLAEKNLRKMLVNRLNGKTGEC
ncbi:MAG: hypothetical protein WC895_04565 [Candidatus Shapirobacteria bacterium]|jgi:hypothetical protein